MENEKLYLYVLIYEEDELNYEVLGVYDTDNIDLARERFKSKTKKSGWGLRVKEVIINQDSF